MADSRKSAGRKKNLLIELGTEELPPKALKNLARAFAQNLFQALVDADVVDRDPADYKFYATPRRLAVWVKGVLPQQPDQIEQRKGPTVQAAFDHQGHPTPAARGFARSCGVSVSRLKQQKADKGLRLVFEKKVQGKKLNQVVTEGLGQSIKALPIPKRMRWGSGDAEFVRPVHWLLALYGSDLLRTEVLGLTANRYTQGHRFHCPGRLKIPSADRYSDALATGWVVADYDMRQSMIVKQVTHLAKKAGVQAVIEQNLLDEVTGLVEWPVALLGEFEDKYLQLPEEVLISTMAGHQKYFHLTTDKGRLANYFVAVSNIKSKTPKRVRQGNERVLRPRLSDAAFFWNTDQKVKLDDRIQALKGVLFHRRLGTVYDKTMRIEKLAGLIAKKLDVDATQAQRAARLCKADLVTDMVGEFPELQGIIGKYYALNQGEPKPVADALDAHYKPRAANDDLPRKPLAQCVAIADRVDSLVGIFAAAEIPTGDKDPFALRRAALGLLRIIIEKKLELDLFGLFSQGMKLYAESNLNNIDTADAVVRQVCEYTNERLKGYFQARGFSVEAIASVRAGRPGKPLDFASRLYAVSRFFSKRREAAESLASANKRISNILSKAGFADDCEFDHELIQDEAERSLAIRVATIRSEVNQHFNAGQYDQGLERLSALKAPVDAFFDQVMVMHQDPAIRSNRLALLFSIRQLFLGVADISCMRFDQA